MIYYVDATAGLDANDGQSEVNAWQTLAKVNGETFVAGDRILLKAGEVWREALIPPSSGTWFSRITFGAYGVGANPLLIGSEVLDASGATLTAAQTYTYELAAATTPGWVWEDTLPLRQESSIATVEAIAGSWWWDDANDILYIHASDGSDVAANAKVYEQQSIDENITAATDYVAIEQIDCTRTGGSISTIGGVKITGRGVIYRNATSSHHRRHCVTFYTNARDGLCENVTLLDAYTSTAGVHYGTGTVNCIFRDCDMSTPTFPLATDFGAGAMRIHGGAVDCIVEDCHLHDGFVLLDVYDVETIGTTVRRNLFDGYSVDGILVRSAAVDTLLHHNVIDYREWTDDPVNIDAAAGTRFENNTVYGSIDANYAAKITGAATGTKVKNNIFVGNRGIEIDEAALPGTEIDYNIYQLFGGGTLFIWKAGNFYVTQALWSAASGFDVHSFDCDPQLAADYSIGISSPAFRAGYSVGLTADYAGTPIPSGEVPCIGAVEYVDTVAATAALAALGVTSTRTAYLDNLSAGVPTLLQIANEIDRRHGSGPYGP